jgi:hypothetical protein
MKLEIKFFLILGLLILGLAGYGYFKSMPGVKNPAMPKPQIEIAPESFDFGDISFGQVVNYTFKVKNLGNEILEIKRVATSCPCATAKINKESFQPGEEGELLVTYDTAAMGRGSHGKGKQERIIYVKSNDPEKPQVEVTIRANVISK